MIESLLPTDLSFIWAATIQVFVTLYLRFNLRCLKKREEDGGIMEERVLRSLLRENKLGQLFIGNYSSLGLLFQNNFVGNK